MVQGGICGGFLFILFYCRKVEMEYRPLSRLAVSADKAPMGGDNLLCEGQTKACAFSALLCGKKRIKHLL